MKNNYSHHKKFKRNIIFGSERAKEYNEVSEEILKTFQQWLDFSRIDVKEFDRRMQIEPHKIEKNTNSDGCIEINVFAGDKKVIVPLIFDPMEGGTFNDFIVNALLLFSHIASRYESKSFEKAVRNFADKVIVEKQ